jgi:hypothetical protein
MLSVNAFGGESKLICLMFEQISKSGVMVVGTVGIPGSWVLGVCCTLDRVYRFLLVFYGVSIYKAGTGKLFVMILWCLVKNQ